MFTADAGCSSSSWHLQGGWANAQTVGSLLEAHTKLALKVCQPQPLAWLAGVAGALSSSSACGIVGAREVHVKMSADQSRHCWHGL